MRKFAILSVVLLAFACTPEKLKLHSSTNTAGMDLMRGSNVSLQLEHNGEGILIRRGRKIIATSAAFSVPDDMPFGTNRLTVATYRGKDTLAFPFEIFVVPSSPSRPLSYKVVNTYPHPRELFTQGFILDGNTIIESSGQYGQSALSIYELGTTKITQQQKLPNDLFAEGLALLNDTLYQVTWREGKCIKYTWNGSRFEQIGVEDYKIREGWGLSAWENSLLWTDGSDQLRWVNPHTLTAEKVKTALTHEGLLGNINESEPYKGMLAANLWQTDRIVFIQPETGVSPFYLDLVEIAINHANQGTLNGIAVKGENLLVTGKNWDVIYELEVVWPN